MRRLQRRSRVSPSSHELAVQEKSVNTNRKAILGVMAAVVVGGLGNGVWEYVLEPALSWGLVGVLNVATLGVQAFKDDLYREIARGFHEESSLSLASTLYFLIGYGTAVGFFFLVRKTKEVLARTQSLSEKLDNLEAIADGRAEPDRSEDNIRLRISVRRAKLSGIVPRLKLVQKAFLVLFVFGIAVFAWTVIGAAKNRYINMAIVHYKQSFSIVAPAATNAELALFDSRFARVASKNDYEVLMADIARVGARGNLTIPAFKAW